MRRSHPSASAGKDDGVVVCGWLHGPRAVGPGLLVAACGPAEEGASRIGVVGLLLLLASWAKEDGEAS